MKAFVALSVALLLCTPLLLPAEAQRQEFVPAPAPLPKELVDYYWSLRYENNYWATSLLLGISLDPGVIFRHGLFSPYGEFQWLKFAIEHDAGLLDTETSKMAADYLRENVLDPIMEHKAIKMQNGHIVTEEEIKAKYSDLNLSEEEMDRLVLAELLYLYVREYVYWDGNRAINNERYLESLSRLPIDIDPNLTPMCASNGLPQVLSFPAETISMQQGICWQQGATLAALYKMTGFDTALYLVPAMYIPFGGFHAVPLLKDEWGFDAPKMVLEQDSMGNPLGGEYLMLDPMYGLDFATARGESATDETLEGVDSLNLVCGFLEPSPYTTGMMPIHNITNRIPLVTSKFVGKV